MTTSTNAHRILDLFHRGGGYLTTSEVDAARLPRVALTRLARQGVITRVERGVYRLSDLHDLPTTFAEATDLLEVQLRYPFARPCLISALHLHGLTTTRPARLQLAVPAHRHALPGGDVPTETFYFHTKYYDAGRCEVDVGGRALTTYTPEKTILDLLRFSAKLGRDVYLEGLKNYLKRGRTGASRLTRTANELGLSGRLSRDLEVLLHDQDR
ncbi:type IV toxin-antitoxin system AbiEi family antitoxin domain-containing protein [Deinococcus pimensis]|uniref:type IV toxin-antitoxin system AbiEi family antitoxin domain-containing protein n=1 Tax=Deinococcus pimensis TaxID=309888 RepID=UPI000487E01A|nr:type IV toxin-antitoxin system AbiEi family antitoxin domain-containing protein [Deinococcus pimensis]